jgi:hypothetical protein
VGDVEVLGLLCAVVVATTEGVVVLVADVVGVGVPDDIGLGVSGADAEGERLLLGDFDAEGLGSADRLVSADGVSGAGGCVAAADRELAGLVVGERDPVTVRLCV